MARRATAVQARWRSTVLVRSPRRQRRSAAAGPARVLPCMAVKPDFAVRHQVAKTTEAATRAMRRNLAAPRFRLPNEGKEMAHPRNVTESEIRELQVNVPCSCQAQSGEGRHKLVVV